jgi:hypothetical protein
MILTTTLLIVVTVAGSGLLNVINIRRAFDDATAEKIAQFQDDRRQLGALETPLFARAVEQLLIDRGRDADIQSLVQNTVAQDTKDGRDGKKDLGLALAYVLDLHANVVATCVETPKLDCKAGDHQPIGAAFGQIAVDAWQHALAAWKANAANKGDALVSFDLVDAGASYRVFAYPVFVGEPATAVGALAPPDQPPPARQGYVILGYDLAPLGWFTRDAARSARCSR